jgi:hypothetical protein
MFRHHRPELLKVVYGTIADSADGVTSSIHLISPVRSQNASREVDRAMYVHM